MANDSIYSRSSGGNSPTPPQGSLSHPGSVSVRRSSGTRVQPSLADWRSYANYDGAVTSPPNYPDVSYGAYLRDGGNLLGIGYNSWKDQRLAAYNTAYNMYQQWYDSTAQQVQRIGAAGLNTNLAYGMATPGTSPGGALAQSSGPSPEQVFFGGINALTGLASGTKALAEAATIINELPESRLKGQLARQIDVAAKAGAINGENTYLGSLYGAFNAIGLGKSQAEQKKSEAIYGKVRNEAEKDLLEYMTSHDAEGKDSDFPSSLYTQSSIASKSDAIVAYNKHKAEFDNLFSDPNYWQAVKKKAIADGDLSYYQAWKLQKIYDDPTMGDAEKVIAMQDGVPGFLSKLIFYTTSNLINSARNTKQFLFGEDWNPFNKK